MSRADRRAVRLLLVAVILAGIAGTVLTLTGIVSGEGTMLFPVAVLGGIIALITVRPHR